MKNKLWIGILSALGMMILILDSKTALQGAADGLRLCTQVIIPSMFPFFVLSNMLTCAITGIPASLLRPLGKFCKIPEGAEILLVNGFLGGYPSGAQGVALACRRGQVKKEAAKRMMGFCSNAGPAFLFGIIRSQFPNLSMVWLIWLIHIFSAMIVGRILPGDSKGRTVVESSPQVSLSAALENSIKITAGICGWIILFRVILIFLDRWFLWLIPTTHRVWICGILELANGCCQLHKIDSIGTRFLVCNAILSFGGLCVTMQTVTATKDLGLGMYLWGKLLHTGLSLSFAAVLLSVQYRRFGFTVVFILAVLSLAAACKFLGHILRNQKKVVAFPR